MAGSTAFTKTERNAATSFVEAIEKNKNTVTVGQLATRIEARLAEKQSQRN